MKLTVEQVRELRELAEAGVSDAELAEHYGIAVAYVEVVRKGRRRAKAGGPIAPPRPRAPRAKRARPRLRESMQRLRRRVADLERAVALLLKSAYRTQRPEKTA